MTDEPKEPTPEEQIANATAAAERLEKANAEMKLLIAQQQAAHTESMLGGTAEAGKEQKKKSQEDIEIAEARRLLAGTGWDKELFPEK